MSSESCTHPARRVGEGEPFPLRNRVVYMLRKLKMKSLKRAAIPLLLLTGLSAVIFLLGGGRDYIEYVQGPVPFESLTMDELPGRYVSINMDMTFGMYDEKRGYSEAPFFTYYDISRFYAIPVGGWETYMWEPGRRFAFVGIEVFSSHDELEIIENNSREFLADSNPSVLRESLTLRGYIRPMLGPQRDRYKEFFMNRGYTEAEWEDCCAPYYIAACDAYNDEVGAYICSRITGALFLPAVVLFVGIVLGVFQLHLVRKIRSGGKEAWQVAELDYRSAREICRDVKGGRQYLFCSRRIRSQVFILDQIAWAYPYSKVHRNNDVDVFTTYKVLIYTDDHKVDSIPCKDTIMCQQIMDWLQQAAPGALLAYTDRLMYLYRHEYDRFMWLRRKQAGRAENQRF